MIFNNLLVSITNTQGEPLEEFKQLETGENSVECWIPSTEGSGFQIHWQPVRNFKPRLGLHCSIKLDGKPVSSGGLKPSEISRGRPGMKDGMTVAEGIRRLYMFGRHNITDREDLALPDNSARELMGTIQVTLNWVKYGKLRPRYGPYLTLEGPGFIHERTVKKGHLGAATLGPSVHKRPSHGCIRERKNVGFPKVVFVFRYGPRDWLEAKDIIVVERHQVSGLQDFEPIPSESVKRERKTALPSVPETLRSQPSTSLQEQGTHLDIIDIDELESDNDSDVIVLNDPIAPKGSTTTIKAET